MSAFRASASVTGERFREPHAEPQQVMAEGPWSCVDFAFLVDNFLSPWFPSAVPSLGAFPLRRPGSRSWHEVGWVGAEGHSSPWTRPPPFSFSLWKRPYQPSTHCAAKAGGALFLKFHRGTPQFLVRPSRLLLGIEVIVNASRSRNQ